MFLKGLKIKGVFSKTNLEMITFEEAEMIAKNRISNDHSIVEIIEKPYGWYFSIQKNECLETGNTKFMEAGSGGFIVEKEFGRVVTFASSFSIEKNFEIYEMGLAYKTYDLTIIKVIDLDSAIKHLMKLSMRFIKPEFEYGVWWKIPREYNKTQFKEILQNLPYTFIDQNFYFRHEEFEEMRKSNCLDFDLKVVDEKLNAKS